LHNHAGSSFIIQVRGLQAKSDFQPPGLALCFVPAFYFSSGPLRDIALKTKIHPCVITTTELSYRLNWPDESTAHTDEPNGGPTMTELILFHHAQGLTQGVQAFAEQLRRAGHHVTVPDLYAEATFDSVEEGVAHAKSIGFGEICARGEAAATNLPANIVYAGFSLGALPAQKLAQTRTGALGAILYHGVVPTAEFSPVWPAGVRLQMHFTQNDPWSEEDIEVAQDLAETVPDGELHLYPGTGHLITDSSLSEYDAVATAIILERTLRFLERF
jgi:dienelactone hydrolase